MRSKYEERAAVRTKVQECLPHEPVGLKKVLLTSGFWSKQFRRHRDYH
jgi:hypothetical protein